MSGVFESAEVIDIYFNTSFSAAIGLYHSHKAHGSHVVNPHSIRTKRMSMLKNTLN